MITIKEITDKLEEIDLLDRMEILDKYEDFINEFDSSKTRELTRQLLLLGHKECVALLEAEWESSEDLGGIDFKTMSKEKLDDIEDVNIYPRRYEIKGHIETVAELYQWLQTDLRGIVNELVSMYMSSIEYMFDLEPKRCWVTVETWGYKDEEANMIYKKHNTIQDYDYDADGNGQWLDVTDRQWEDGYG